jgi:hypothetical protein
MKYEEGHHFTCRRIAMVFVNFVVFFATHMVWKNKGHSNTLRISILTTFVIVEICFTALMTQRV